MGKGDWRGRSVEELVERCPSSDGGTSQASTGALVVYEPCMPSSLMASADPSSGHSTIVHMYVVTIPACQVSSADFLSY